MGFFSEIGNKPMRALGKLEPDGTDVELVPGFRVIVLTSPCPEIFEGGGGVEFWIAGVFSK